MEITEFSCQRVSKQNAPAAQVAAEVTAYYKPLPKQKRFITGSYRRETRLNGTGVTVTGEKARIGVVAADPAVFPFGSVLEIPGRGKVVVKDIGSQIKGHRIDVFVGAGDSGRKRALKWGRKILFVKILRLGKKEV